MRTIWSCLISDQGWQYVGIGENAQPANALSDRWRPSVDGSKIKGVVSHLDSRQSVPADVLSTAC
jgi:hypothetical protein